MPDYRRAFVPGGCRCFTVNPRERKRAAQGDLAEAVTRRRRALVVQAEMADYAALIRPTGRTMLIAMSFISTAAAQVIIPHGEYGSDLQTYLVAALSLAALVFAMWRYFRSK